ncbi:Gti1/Pac2 family-domain-containing protein [Calycina marina]|uniref:Gti1/Pac2 family-domain-containing protein n=1 Tax=Calycina marina TaxID=1763456 RepID=A0A9P7YZU4_9HELO|nr:Gti1/Pac2 family-domain-containing protein [Calycina marina]
METYRGLVRTPADAIKLFEACRLGLYPRVQRRLSEKERQSISSGSVFVWDEREAGMRRWTDGKSWSASRVSGSFLTYREMEGKRGGGSFAPAPVRRPQGRTPESGRASDEDQDIDGPDGYRYKPDGLMKQSFSINTSNNQHLHLISYYSRPNPNAPDLPQPTTDPNLRNIVPPKGMYPETTVHDPSGPAASRSPMNQNQYMPGHTQMQHVQQRGGPPPYPYQQHPGQHPAYSWQQSPANPPYPPLHPGALYVPAHQSPYQNSSEPYMNQHHSPHPPPSQFSPQAPTGHQPIYGPVATAMPDMSHQPSHPLAGVGQRPMSSATAAQLGWTPYNPNISPRTIQAQLMAAQAMQSNVTPLDPRLQHQPVQLAPVNLAPVQVDGSAPPRTTTPTPVSTNTTNAQGDSPRSNSRLSPQGTPKMTGSTSQAQSIPSISSLVHAEDSVSVMNDNKSNSRTGNSSPKADHNRATDMRHGKLHQGNEDQRAVRVLDSKFRF